MPVLRGFRALFFSILCQAPLALAADPPLYMSAPSELGFVLGSDGLVAARCTGRVCDFERGTPVPVPAELLGSVGPASFTRLQLEEKRVAVRIRIPTEDRAWEALVTLPISAGTAPGLPFADFTGMTVDEEGERVGRWLEVYPKEKGRSEVVVGSLSDDVTLCGRRTLLDPKVLYAKDLELHRVKLMRLSQEERAAAPRLVPSPDDPKAGTAISRARAASSGKGSPAALSDDRVKTTWAEDRGGNGSGEFVVLRTPETLPVNQLYWRYPNEPSSVPLGFWVATDSAVFRIDVPKEAATPGAALAVTLPEPVTTSCLALVLDEASSAEADQDVALAEFGARTAVDEAAIEALVQQLSDPNLDGDPLVRSLIALGKGAVRVLSRRFHELSVAGRARAMLVYDALPCEDSARAYARAVVGGDGDRHAAERLSQCGSVGQGAAVKELGKGPPERTRVLAGVLAGMNPKRAARELVPLLAHGNRERRKALREVLTSIAVETEAQPVLRDWLRADDLGTAATVELLRALGPHATHYQPAAATRLLQIVGHQPGFRERYLLLAPAAELAAAEPAITTYLARALREDEEAAVRARAARVAPALPALLPALLAAAEEPHVRVREAAILNLTERRIEQASAVFSRRAVSDPWPFVRAASVRGLVALAPSTAIDRTLAERAANDVSADVRRPALLGLGSRDARAHVEVVRERLDDDEDAYVRAAAAASLGMLCDVESLDVLTRHARVVSRLTGQEDQQILGRAALQALGRIAPSDLDERLRVFEGPEVPPWAKQAADAARRHPEPCSQRARDIAAHR